MRYRYALILAFGTYSLFLVATLPAQLLYQWVTPDLLPIQLEGLSGSIWNGHADVVNAGPDKSIQNLNWHVKPFHLLMGCVRADITINDSSLRASGETGYCLSGDIIVRSTQIDTDASRLLSLFEQPAKQSSGAVSIHITTTTISDGFPTELNGHIEWHNARLHTPDTISIGDLAAELTLVTDSVKIDVTDKAGPLTITLNIVLDKSLEYKLNGFFLPRKNASDALIKGLSYLGSPDPEGAYKIRLNGLL